MSIGSKLFVGIGIGAFAQPGAVNLLIVLVVLQALFVLCIVLRPYTVDAENRLELLGE